MKKVLTKKLPIIIAIISIFIFCIFLRINLYFSANQLVREFKSQNKNEIYSADTLKIASRLNSFSSSLNWYCIVGEINQQIFYSLTKGSCSTNLLYQKVELLVPESNDLKISFTLGLSKDNQLSFLLFSIFQFLTIIGLILTTKFAENEKTIETIKMNKLARKMFHDIRSPLAYLNSEIKNSNNQNLNLAITRINEVANSMLDFTKNKSIVDLPDFHLLTPLIKEAIQEIKATNPDVILSFETDEYFSAYLVKSEFKRLLSNLLLNSIQSTPNIIKLEIKISKHDSVVNLLIIDNGPGIPKHLMNKIGKQEFTTKTNGNGLGILSAIESLSEWGGNFKILKSDSDGTSIQLTLKSQKLSKMILLDNDELVRMNWQFKAKKANIDLIIYSEPNQLRSDLKLLEPDAIFYLDSELGNEKGEEIAIYLKEKGFNNIYMCSGHPTEHFSHLTFLKGSIDKNPPF